MLFFCRELKRVGRSVSLLLTDAADENRVTCGLRPAIKALDRDPQRVLCCVVPQNGTGDAASHIQATLLQAFCYENCIAIIKVGLLIIIKCIILHTVNNNNNCIAVYNFLHCSKHTTINSKKIHKIFFFTILKI